MLTFLYALLGRCQGDNRVVLRCQSFRQNPPRARSEVHEITLVFIRQRLKFYASKTSPLKRQSPHSHPKSHTESQRKPSSIKRMKTSRSIAITFILHSLYTTQKHPGCDNSFGCVSLTPSQLEISTVQWSHESKVLHDCQLIYIQKPVDFVLAPVMYTTIILQVGQN